MGDRKGQENDFVNKAGELNYDPFLNPNLYFASPFIRSPPRSNYTERKLSKRIGAIFFISLEMRKEGTDRQEQFS